MKKALLIGLLLFGMNTQAKATDPVKKTNPVKKTTTTSLHCHYKAAYYEIRSKYEDGEITLNQAQARWQKAKKRIKKEEAI